MDHANLIEQFSIECRKAKTKVITLVNPLSNQNTKQQSADDSREKVKAGFGFTSDRLRKWREYFKSVLFLTLKWKSFY